MNRVRLTIKSVLFVCLAGGLLTACGGSSTSNSNSGSRQTSNDDEVGSRYNSNQSPEWCLPDVNQWRADPERPAINLIGDQVVVLQPGEEYIDAGATAYDEIDGDITSEIRVTGLDSIDTSITGDVMLRYEVSDSDQNAALPVYRLLRIGTEGETSISKRFFDEVDAVWEYVEFLPKQFGTDPSARYPLLISNHGWGMSKRFDMSGSMALTDRHPIVSSLSIESIGDDHPYITLLPQRCWSDFNTQQVELLHTFVEWAKRNYPIDENRVYMTGLSMGGWATWEYIRVHPDNIAAAAPMAGGGDWSRICSASSVPVWAFTARDDTVVPYTGITRTVDALNACSPAPLVEPKITVFETGGHVINDNVFDQSYLNLGDPQYDIYDQNIFDWFLQYRLN